MWSMGDRGLFKQGWKWLQSRKQGVVGTQIAVSYVKDGLVILVDRHWPMICSWFLKLGRFLLMLLLQWRNCVVRGFWSLIGLNSTALFVILWSCFLSLTSTSCLFYVLLILGAAGATIHYLGYIPGLFIVGLFGILTLWIYGNFWITGVLFIVGGVQSEEAKKSEPIAEDFTEDCNFSATTGGPENLASYKSSCKMSSTTNIVNVQRESSPSKVVKTDSSSLDEMKRIMNSSNHYEAIGFPQNQIIDPDVLKKEYRKKAVLVHPDKNMGNSLASESFKKLQCAYEVLSDITKKSNYDEQLWKEEYRSVTQPSHGSSQQNGVEYRSEESRHIECTKCGNSHIWICTNRSKARARWCQECRQYHQAKDGDGWVEYGCSTVISTTRKVEIPRAFVCAESKIFDVSEWAVCQLQGMVCSPNTHRPSFHVNMVGLDRQRSNPSRYPWGLDAEMMSEDEDEFELWFQQALASGLFSETSQRRKSWSPFKINHSKHLKRGGDFHKQRFRRQFTGRAFTAGCV